MKVLSEVQHLLLTWTSVSWKDGQKAGVENDSHPLLRRRKSDSRTDLGTGKMPES